MSTILYYSFHLLGFIGAIIYILLMCPKFNFSRIKGLILTVLTYATTYAFMLLLKFIITGSGGQNIVRVFVFFPIFTLIFATVLNLDARKSLDLVAPAICIVQAISHIGCIFEGCCYSNIKVSWGIYNPLVGDNLFPNQILEAIVAGIIAAILILIMFKKNFDTHGLIMPLMLACFGITRFFLEFMRDNQKLFWNISELALWALLMFIVGCTWLVIYKIKQKKL